MDKVFQPGTSGLVYGGKKMFLHVNLHHPSFGIVLNVIHNVMSVPAHDIDHSIGLREDSWF